ncbi:MAG: hypothetical protein DMF63_03730 [Acidobacteria bacterium]|nr:MAG: hypothetical protein DMF63_03730 [Acidobacteriota bacterium]
MSLADKMFSRSKTSCPLRSECGKESDRSFVDDLFARSWEVFVIKRDPVSAKFGWYTLCCEEVDLQTSA